MITKKKVNNDEILNNVIHSTNSALSALSQLEQNLIKGRFKEGIKPYETMINTLIGQRIWSSDKNNYIVNSNFIKLALSAQNIISILQPYIVNLTKLQSVDGELSLNIGQNNVIVNSLGNKENTNSDIDYILQIIQNKPKGQVSYSKLKTELQWNRKKLDSTLEEMNREGLISTSVISARKVITVAK